MPTIAGNVESKSRKGNSIKVDGNWYGCFKSADLDHVEWKDDVKFSYEVKGDYRNIKGPVTTGAASSSPAASGGKPSGGFSNVGVELGHAANLAMRMMEQDNEVDAVGSTAYYKQFSVYTEDMYKLMKALRVKVSAPEYTSDVKPTAPKAPEVSDDEDLF